MATSLSDHHQQQTDHGIEAICYEQVMKAYLICCIIRTRIHHREELCMAGISSGFRLALILLGTFA